MATAKKIMELAEKYVGTQEKPLGSNNVIFNTDYYGKPVSGNNYSWCCVFVWDIFRMAGASELFYNGQKTSYCPTVNSWGISKGLSVPKDSGKYGDIVLFDWNKNKTPDHIGFIYCKNPDGTYKTIEGNTSLNNNTNGGSVMFRNRSQSLIQTIIRPQYDKESNIDNKIHVGEKTTNPNEDFIIQLQSCVPGMKIDGKYSRAFAITLPIISRFRNTKHRAVMILQNRLITLGYSCGNYGADCKFGTDTKNAVVKYQADHGLKQDGIVGEMTWTSLMND